MKVLVVGASRGIGWAAAHQYLDDGATVLRRSIARLQPADNGGFFDPDGAPLPW